MFHRLYAMILLVLLLPAAVGGVFLPSTAAASAERTVRVGFFNYYGYHMINDGIYSGYGYEYLQYLKQYANWQFVYVGYDKSWQAMQDMLDRGEIDFVTLAQKTPEREEKYLYSAKPVGSSTAVLTIKAGNEDLLSHDYRGLSGIRVGLLSGNACNQQFIEFAAEKGFTYTPIFFISSDDMAKALQDGAVDALVNSNMQQLRNEWIIAEFAPRPFYAIFRKEDEELCREFNAAVDVLEAQAPDLTRRLMMKYYKSDSGNIPFTIEERQYLEKLRHEGRGLNVCIDGNSWPLSYYSDGQASGIIPEIVTLIGEKLELPVNFVPAKQAEHPNSRSKALIHFDLDVDSHWAEQHNYRLTQNYLDLSFSLVTTKNFHGDVNSIAMLKNMNMDQLTMQDIEGRYRITYYDTPEECLAAVKNRVQDAALFHTYMAQYYIYREDGSFLQSHLTTIHPVQLAAAVSGEADIELLNVLNRVLNNLSQAEFDRIIMRVTDYGMSRPSLIDYIYYDPKLSMLIFGSLCLFLLVLVVNYFIMKNNNLQYRQNRDFKHFISCVCQSNDQVSEIDFDGQRVRTYNIIDGQVKVATTAYVYGEVFLNKLHPDDVKPLQDKLTQAAFEKLVSEGGNLYFEARRLCADGKYHWYAYSLQSKELANGIYSGCIVFCRNIDVTRLEEQRQKETLRDALEMARKASEAKGIFLSRMSHEIRTPLNAVIGYLDMVKMYEGDVGKITHFISQCEAAARHLLNIINDVLDISSVESGKMKIAAEPFELRRLLTDIAAMFSSRAHEAGVEFKLRVYDVTEECLIGDPLRINQILLNLLSNAVKFTPQGGLVELIVTQLQVNADRVQLRFEVHDTGIGMAPEYMNRIFKPFEQADASISQKYGGTGLGLSITHNLVQMMKGSIAVDSELDKGTTFTVHLYFSKAEQTAAKQEDLSKIRLLLVNDDKEAARYTKAMLKNFRIKSDTAVSEAEALKQLKRRSGTAYEYDACLVDLAASDAMQVAQAIHAENDGVKVIVAQDYGAAVQAPAESGDWLRQAEKPLFQSTLFDVLCEELHGITDSAAAPPPKSVVDVKGLRVLIAEDNAMNMEIAVGILSKYGIELTQAGDGQAAVDTFVSSKPGDFQLILMDVQMPKLNGYEAARTIRRSSHPEAATIPIIAMTANAFAEDVSEALAAGMNDHIAKPVEYDKLFAIINRLVVK